MKECKTKDELIDAINNFTWYDEQGDAQVSYDIALAAIQQAFILKHMKKYRITIRTCFGLFDIDDIEAQDENEAFHKACEEAKKEIDCAKLDEVFEYETE